MEYSGHSFVKEWEKETLTNDQKSFIEKRVEPSDVSTRSTTTASTIIDFRPRNELEDLFEGPYRQLIGERM